MATVTPILAPSLETYFIDKDTGLPLSGGLVYTYSDSSRGTPKYIYTLTGNPPNYTYTALPNPCVLTANGTFSDTNGNDIIPYYFPYDGTPTNTLGTIDNYYIVVTSATGVTQFSRSAWPNASASGSTIAANFNNYIPNGQFLTHNSIAANPLASPPTVAGQITQAVTQLAPGGWTFVKAAGFTSVDTVTFQRNNAPIASPGLPTQNPRYNLQFVRSSVGGGDNPSLMVQFPDVNKFSYGNTYTFGFVGQAQSNVTVTFSTYRYFGSGTSQIPIPIAKGTFAITPTAQAFSQAFTFDSNVGLTIGPNDDDYVGLMLTFSNIIQNVTLDNFILTDGDVSFTYANQFPATTNAHMLVNSLVSATPKSDGSDLYLPLKFTQSGLVADHSEVGQVVAMPNLSSFSGNLSTNSNLMLANGQSYPASGYSPLGIPYSRLQSVYLAGGALNTPQFGTGANFVTAYIEAGAPQKFTLTTNMLGTPAIPVDVSTHFTFTQIIAGSTGGNGVVAYTGGTNYVTAMETALATQGVTAGGGTGPFAGNSVTEYRNATGTYHAFNIVVPAASAIANPGGAGYYIQFYTGANAGHYMWFKITNETQPSGIGTAIPVVLDAAMSNYDVATVIANALSGLQLYTVTCGAASTFTAGAYWQFTANATLYVPWYIIDGVGTAPTVSNSVLIPISIASTATAAQVASVTQAAINAFYFAVPNLAGLTLRGADPTGEWDIDFYKRFSLINTLTGGNAGSFELDQLSSHYHTGSIVAGTAAGQGSAGRAGIPPEVDINYITNQTGGSETRSVNMSVIWAIKY